MIVVDVHEPEIIPRKLESPHEIRSLLFGDYQFLGGVPGGYGMIGVERKTISDLISSIKDGRLAGRQIPGLAQTCQVYFLLVEGIWKENHRGYVSMLQGKNWIDFQMKANSLRGFLISASCLMGARIIRTQSRLDTSKTLDSLFNWFQKDWEDHRSAQVLAATPEGPAADLGVGLSLVGRMVSQIPGIGYEKALKVSQEFKTPKEMMDAKVTDWQGVPGIGRKLAAACWDAIRKG